MTEWKTKKVGELANTQLGKILNKNKQTGKYSHPYLRSLNVQWGHVELSDLNHMDILPNEYEKFTLSKGDLLICEGGESGRVAIWNHDVAMGFQNALHRVRAGGEISNKYLYFYFEWLVKNQLIEHLFNGVTIKHFPQENLRAVEISYPSLPEQQKIVEILEDHLSRLDAALADVKQAKLKAAQFRRSLLQAAFTGNLTSDGTRLMTDLPTGWKKVRFGDTFKLRYGKAIDKALRKDSARYPVVGSAGIMTYTDEPLIEEPTIVIGRKGNVGSIQIFEEGCYPIDTTYYMQSTNQFNIKFLTLLLTSLELMKLDSSTATPSLRREDLENVSFFVPPLTEQQKIVEILEDHLSRLDASVAIADAMEKQSASLRRSLLQAAFTGQLTKEVASV